MGETQQLLALWRRAQGRGEDVCLATVVHVEGSSYRKVGARMLVTAGGERSGTVSGGCLEAEVSRRVWWLTREGAAVGKYQSSFDEDGTGAPWGLGCGGTVWLLFERNPVSVLQALEDAAVGGRPSSVLCCLEPAGTLAVMNASKGVLPLREPNQGPPVSLLQQALEQALHSERNCAMDAAGQETNELPVYLAEHLPAAPRLTIFGAGDDAQPLVRFGSALGWRIAVADGRTHLLRPERFPEEPELRPLSYGEVQPACGFGTRPLDSCTDVDPLQRVLPQVDPGVASGEFAVILTHSYDQDRALLRALLPAGLRYLGILGPRHRTARLLEEVAPALGWSLARCWACLHAPVGLDLGVREPAAIALAIVAELQAVLSGRRVAVERDGELSVAAARG